MFDPLQEIRDMNLDWLAANGWTLRGNLAYRHILYEYNCSKSKTISSRRAVEIIKEYGAQKQASKITEACREFVDFTIKRGLYLE